MYSIDQQLHNVAVQRSDENCLECFAMPFVGSLSHWCHPIQTFQ